VTTPTLPTAQVRFVNAIPDTGAVAVRFVDYIENTPTYVDLTFRGTIPTYRPINAGNRHFKLFLSDTIQANASTVLDDVTYNFEPNTHYTVVFTGFKRTGGTPAFQSIVIKDDTPPTPNATSFALRVYHLGAGLGNVDAYYHTKTAGAPGTALGTNIGYLGKSNYATIPVTNDSLRVFLAPTGTTTQLADVLVNIGTRGTATMNPSPGTNVGGSVITAIIVPRSTAGSKAPQTAAFQAPSVIYLYDNRPANTAG
jgi:hypothetical protein